MLQGSVDSDVHSFATDEPIIFMSKPPLGRHSRSSHIGNDKHVKAQNESEFSLQTNSSQSYANGNNTLATLTESFSASSISQSDSFEVYEVLPRHREIKRDASSYSPAAAAATSFYRSNKYNPPVQRPLAPVESLFAASSSDSWDELNTTPREVSLLDFAESRDDEEDGYEPGHDGDNERHVHINIDQMQGIITQFHQSIVSVPGSSFQGSLPKFAQGPSSHLQDGPKQKRIRDISRSFHSSSSFVSLRSYVSQDDCLHSVQRGEKETSLDQIRAAERKRWFQSLKDIIFCIPGNYE